MRRLLQLTALGLLMAALWPLLRELLGRSSTPASPHGAPTTAPPRDPRSGNGSPAGEGDGLASRNKAELYQRAQELDIPGRSKMTKDELAAAIAAARSGPS